MFKHALAAVAASCLLAVAGCGSGTPNQTMNRVLRTLPKPPQTFTLAPVVARGIDFGWSCASSSGFQFGASYLSDSSKDWTRACLARWPHQVYVWETSGTTPLAGRSAGIADARAAAAEARALGAPASVHIDFAIDFDATAGQQSAIDSYFRGADSILGVSRVGDYGGYWPTTRLCAAHLVTRSWQTYAWSGGNWAPASCAPLEQYLNGAAVDYDRAIAPDYGQVPAFVAPHPAPQPKPKPPAPKPKPKPAPSYNENFAGGFQRGFVVGYDRHQRRPIPAPTFAATNSAAFNVGFHDGFAAGWKAAR